VRLNRKIIIRREKPILRFTGEGVGAAFDLRQGRGVGVFPGEGRVGIYATGI